ncbi:MAG: polyphosphate polymerase domain-containing protein [bacterium]
MKFRHEFKHKITVGEYITIRQRIEAICRRDANTDDDGNYIIRSLYFDNFNDKALKEKIDGVNKREKFRIRYYNHNTDFIRLEKKSKINSLCLKQSSKINKHQVADIINGNYQFLLDPNNELFTEFYSKIKGEFLKPRTIVDYSREAFIYDAGNVRITFDSDIRTGISSIDFLNPYSPTISIGSFTILEVKYDEFIPSVILDAVQTGGQSSSAFSKYAGCRMYI